MTVCNASGSHRFMYICIIKAANKKTSNPLSWKYCPQQKSVLMCVRHESVSELICHLWLLRLTVSPHYQLTWAPSSIAMPLFLKSNSVRTRTVIASNEPSRSTFLAAQFIASGKLIQRTTSRMASEKNKKHISLEKRFFIHFRSDL